MRVVLHVRRVRGVHATCTTHTFAERLPQSVPPAAQRTGRVPTALPPLGLALGGEAGARLSATRPMSRSPETLRRLVHQLPAPPMATPARLGVEAWAIRRGRPDGPVRVDWERPRPIDRWPDRTADPFATGLRTHPGVILLSRGRSAA